MNMDSESMEFVTYLLLTLVLYFISVLSKRLGDVLRIKKYYYLYYAGMFFTFLSSVAPFLSSELEYIRYVFLAIGLTLGLIATIKYWGWLVREFVIG